MLLLTCVSVSAKQPHIYSLRKAIEHGFNANETFDSVILVLTHFVRRNPLPECCIVRYFDCVQGNEFPSVHDIYRIYLAR